MRLPEQSDSDPTTDIVEAIGVDDGLRWVDWAVAGGGFVATIVLAQLVKWTLNRVLSRRVDAALAALMARLAGYVVVTVGLVYVLGSLGVQIVPLLGALGIAGLALAFALQDILENFVAGVLLQLKRPFTYGDQIMVNDREGTVVDIDSRLVLLETVSGEVVKIPTSTVIKSDIINYTQRGRRRTTLPIGVAYGSNLDTAQRVLLGAVRSADGVFADPAAEVLLEGFGDSSIDFVVRFWHEPTIASFWQVRSNVAFAVERELAAAEITIPFPQRTMWWAGDTDD